MGETLEGSVVPGGTGSVLCIGLPITSSMPCKTISPLVAVKRQTHRFRPRAGPGLSPFFCGLAASLLCPPRPSASPACAGAGSLRLNGGSQWPVGNSRLLAFLKWPIRIGLPNAEVCVWGPRLAFPACPPSSIPCLPRTVCATVEKVKHPASQKFFTPSGVRSCAIPGRGPCTEFRHDSCNTAPR
jgi:hypothetical protein